MVYPRDSVPYLDFKSLRGRFGVWLTPSFTWKGLPKGNGWDDRRMLSWGKLKIQGARAEVKSQKKLKKWMEHQEKACLLVKKIKGPFLYSLTANTIVDTRIYFWKSTRNHPFAKRKQKKDPDSTVLTTASRYKSALVFMWFKKYHWEQTRKIRLLVCFLNFKWDGGFSENLHPYTEKTNLGSYV